MGQWSQGARRAFPLRAGEGGGDGKCQKATQGGGEAKRRGWEWRDTWADGRGLTRSWKTDRGGTDTYPESGHGQWREDWVETQETCALVPALALICCGTLGQSFPASVPQFPFLFVCLAI